MNDATVASGGRPVALGGSQRIARLARGTLAWLERQALFVAALAAAAAVSLADAPSHINQDAWLSLVDGRYVAQHGIPHSDPFGVLTHGVRWIDQQWLAQLAVYGLHQLGGLSLYSIVYVALTVGSFGMAIAASRRLGGSEAHVLWVLPVTAFLYFANSGQIRTQGFAYPMFVGTLWLLASDIRAPGRRRVYLVFPLLIVWGNLHGSASVGAGLAVLYGVSLLVHGRRSEQSQRARGRAVTFILGAPLCLLITPYGISGLAYYRETLLNPAFRKVLVEWQPITTQIIMAVPFFLAAFAAVWVLGRGRERGRTFEALTLLVLIAGAISAVRNVTYFSLALLILLPSMLGAITAPRAPSTRRGRVNVALVGASAVLLIATLLTVAVKPSSWFERDYDARALAQVEGVVAREPGVRVFAEEHFSDWLLWHDPSLAGHVAYDARMELLTASQLREIVNPLEVQPPGDRGVLAGYGLLVLEPSLRLSQLLLEQPGTAVVLRNASVAVATRPPA